MINCDINSNELGNCGTATATSRKQQPNSTKKVALRDVQNNKRNFVRDIQESLLLVEGRQFADTAKVCGTKRLTPEYSSTHPCASPLSNNGANEHCMYARRKFQFEVGQRRIQPNMNKFSGSQFTNFPYMQKELPPKQNHMASMMKNSHSALTVPNFLYKPRNGLPAVERDCSKVTLEVPQFKGTDDQQRTERYIRLQSFIKHCDESNQRDNVQMLLHLSPAELSRHAIELEKRAIQLTIEEGKEMQRMKAMNILGKSATNNNSSQITQLLQPNI